MLPDVDLRTIRCFVALADELSFTRAAERLHMSQPSLSGHIRKFEQLAGAPLFERTTRQVELSMAGEKLLPHCRELLDRHGALRAEIAGLRGSERPPVVLGTPIYTFSLAEHGALLGAVHRYLPDIPVRVDNGFASDLIRRLVNGDVDLALVIARPVAREQYRALLKADAIGELDLPDDLPRFVLRTAATVLALPREHPLAVLPVIPKAALKNISVAIPSVQHGRAIVEPITRILTEAGADISVPPEAHAIALEWYCREYRAPAISLGWFQGPGEADVVYRPIEGLHLETMLCLVRSADRATTAPVERIWDVAQRLTAPLPSAHG